MELESLAQCSQWECPVCRHGEAVLGDQAKSAIDPQEMHEKMLSAMREDRSVRAASQRHRDEFLRSQIHLIEPFCARQALTRLTREVKEHVLEISARVQALGKNGNCFEAIVLGAPTLLPRCRFGDQVSGASRA